MAEKHLDQDTCAVIDVLREAVRASGLTQLAFTRGMGTSSARFSNYLTGSSSPSAYFLMRASRLGAAVEAAAERGLWSSPVAGAEARRLVAAGADTAAIWAAMVHARSDLQQILAIGDDVLVASWELRPPTTDSRRWDTLLAGLAGHEFAEAGIEAPEWTDVEPLDSPWLPAHPLLQADPELTVSHLEEQTPDWLAELNILVPERHLANTG